MTSLTLAAARKIAFRADKIFNEVYVHLCDLQHVHPTRGPASSGSDLATFEVCADYVKSRLAQINKMREEIKHLSQQQSNTAAAMQLTEFDRQLTEIGNAYKEPPVLYNYQINGKWHVSTCDVISYDTVVEQSCVVGRLPITVSFISRSQGNGILDRETSLVKLEAGMLFTVTVVK